MLTNEISPSTLLIVKPHFENCTNDLRQFPRRGLCIERIPILKALARHNACRILIPAGYVDLVHSAALRMSGDPHSAKDITQCVFVALSQYARQLTDRPTLAGWLKHQTVCVSALSLCKVQCKGRLAG